MPKKRLSKEEDNRKVAEQLGLRSPAAPVRDLAERKRKQYQEALEKREEAKTKIAVVEKSFRELKSEITECQSRINVMEYLFTSSGAADPAIEYFLMTAIEGENETMRWTNSELAKSRKSLAKHRHEYALAERTIGSIIENGPDMQEQFDLDDDDVPDGKSRSAGK